MKLFVVLLSALSLSPALAVQGAKSPAASSAPVFHSGLAENIGSAYSAITMIVAGGGNGTGFFIDKKTVVTNFHVVYGLVKHASSFKIVQGRKLFPIKRVLALSALHDLAVLEIEGEHNGAYLKMSDEAQPEGEMYTIGFQLGELSKIELKNSTNYGSKDWVFSSKWNTKKPGAWNNYRYGISGSPVLDDKAQVHGVASASAVGGFVSATKVKYLKEVLSQARLDLDRQDMKKLISEELDNLEQQAEEGNPSAEYIWGLTLQNYLGRGNEYIDWFKRAADHGNVDAMYSLAEDYAMSALQTLHVLEARERMKSGDHNMKSGDHHMQSGNHHMHHHMSRVSPEVANLFKTMSEEEIKEFINTKKKSAERYFRMAAEKGHPGAQYSVGMMIKEKFIDEEPEQAFYWCKLAQAQGHHHAYRCVSPRP